MTITFPIVHWPPLLPALVVIGAALLVLVVDLWTKGPERSHLAWLSLAGLGIAAIVSVALWGKTQGTLENTLALDNYALFFNLLFCFSAALTVLMSISYLNVTAIRSGEYYALILFATAGMIFMAAGNDLVVIFLGLETMSMAVYILAGIWRQDLRSSEAALKYFLLGAFATGFLLYGIALLYGVAGSTQLDLIARYLQGAAKNPGPAPPPMLFVGVGMLLVGFAFKVALVPFHVWTPDVYEGAPTAVTGFMAVAVKAAGFAAFVRLFMDQLSGISDQWQGVLWVLAALTMTVGNVVAVVQENIKRMLAYSSIAHAGYIAVAMVAGSDLGGAAVLFYLLAYTLMNLGAFGVVMAVARQGEPNENIADYAGLGFRHPFLGLAMSIVMLSLIGVPPLAGFAGKFYVFSAAVQAGYIGLAVIGVLNSVISAYYYIGVVVTMYMAEGGKAIESLWQRPSLFAAVFLTVAGTILLGIFPSPWMQLAQKAFHSLASSPLGT